MEKTRWYLYEHKGLGKTAEEVASYAGVSKGTVTVSVSRGLQGLRDAFEIIRMVLDFVRHILPVFVFMSEPVRIWEWWS
ncbi:hypothetical protein [Streptomyces sp. NPDC003480]